MTPSYNDTKAMIDLILKSESADARTALFVALAAIGRNDAEFYAGIVAHASGMGLSGDQWLDLLSKLPNRLLRSQLSLNRILSEEQLKRLPPAIG
ncbi:MAG: hypothetical protein C5B49_09255 [Bdellovibrio sp.]|nr:MAG: hypothetical protein C5B49_09255 [Bdellovibrio sp.]